MKRIKNRSQRLTLRVYRIKGHIYGDRLGYDVHLDVDYGGEFTKGETALNHIRGERPCMFQFDVNRDGIVDHYGAIEGVKYKEKKNLFVWYNWEMWYLVNYGWGDKLFRKIYYDKLFFRGDMSTTCLGKALSTFSV